MKRSKTKPPVNGESQRILRPRNLKENYLEVNSDVDCETDGVKEAKISKKDAKKIDQKAKISKKDAKKIDQGAKISKKDAKKIDQGAKISKKDAKKIVQTTKKLRRENSELLLENNNTADSELLRTNGVKGAKVPKKDSKKIDQTTKKLRREKSELFRKSIQTLEPSGPFRLEEKECYRQLLEQHQIITEPKVLMRKTPLGYGKTAQQWVQNHGLNVSNLIIINENQRIEPSSDDREAKILESNKRLLMDLRQFDVVFSDESDDDDYFLLPEITPAMDLIIDAALDRGRAEEIVTEAFGLQITRRDINTVSASNWLNDEVINFYFNLLAERGRLDNYPSCFAFNSFFYPKLMDKGHEALKRWTRKIDIFCYDLILIPVHLGLHWCLAVIDFRFKKILYFDSMLGHNENGLEALSAYLEAESLDKKKTVFDLEGWESVHVKNIPEQMNGSDCGMFTLKFAEFVTRNAKITFTQLSMPYFRRRMVYEIVKQKLL